MKALYAEINNQDDLCDPYNLVNDIEGNSEDEGIDDYKKGGYHPVHVGELLMERYVTI